MKLTVLNWFKDVLLIWIAKLIEITFRIILFLLPLGIYLLLIQGRGKVSKVSSLSTFTNDKSVWQHIFPGFILVAIDSDQFKNAYLKAHGDFQTWVSRHKYTLAFLFMTAIVCLMIMN